MSVSSYKSTSDASDTPFSDSSPSPSAGFPKCSLPTVELPQDKFESSSETDCSQNYDPSEGVTTRVLTEGEWEKHAEGTVEINVVGAEGIQNTSQFNIESVDTRTYDDFKSSIERKESLLADILDLDCLKMDHEVGEREEGEIEAVNGFLGHLTFERELSSESDICSTPSTIKELSPAPDLYNNSDFYARCYQHCNSFSSVESGIDPHSQQQQCSLDEVEDEKNEDPERLESNTSEDRVSCLSYGPPSGSSLLSIGGRPHSDRPERGIEPKDMLTITDTSEVADITWSYAALDVQEGHVYDEEKITGGWFKHKLPSSVHSLAVSENTLAFVDSHGCLFFKDAGLENKAWKKVKLSVKVTQVLLSPSGSKLWIQCDSQVYSLSSPALEALSTSQLTLVTRNVQQMCVDDDDAWYINTHNQVAM